MSYSERVPFRERLTCTVREARELSGLGKTKIFALIKDGRLETIKLDGHRLVRVPSLLALLQAAE